MTNKTKIPVVAISLVLAMGFLVIVASIFYYFVLFLPKQEQSKQELARLEHQLRVSEAREGCIENVNKNFEKAFDKDWLAPEAAIPILLRQREEQRAECLKKFPL